MLARLTHFARQRSPAEIGELLLLNMRHAARRFTAAERARRDADDAFDRLWGTDTGGVRTVGSLGIDSVDSHRLHGYQAAQDAMFDRLLSAIDIDPAGYGFVDYGSGKGRILLLAALRPFAHVTGIEIAPAMHAIAEANIALFSGKAPVASGPVRSLCCDARAFDPPAGPLVTYFYNPCHGEILRPMVAKLEATHAAAPRPIWALYLEPLFPEAFEASGHWTLVEADDGYRIYRLG
ncbi:class I SAM-dependent methyltransferase [Sphingomonas sp. 1P06PA]|uniref:SAM-dependent methyltransferase n=1 Tax=Sphingomonas sp. 1P06PA TaxID=554121 RepID=UPI0039A6F0B7